MSIFSVITFDEFKQAFLIAQSSPEILVALGIVCVVVVIGLFFITGLTIHHLSGFYSRIVEEEEQLRIEYDNKINQELNEDKEE